MSKVKIEGNASGTGTLTISAPATNTDRSLTLPDGAGEILTDAGLKTINGSSIVGSGDLEVGGGKVLQVVQDIDTPYTSTTSETVSATNISASITPSSTSNKVLIEIHLNGIYNSASGWGLKLQIWKNGSLLKSLSDQLYKGIGLYVGSASWSYLDSPSTTSATTYALAWAGTGAEVGFNNYGQSSDNVSLSSITLTEIAG